jgi:hypothetical protein
MKGRKRRAGIYAQVSTGDENAARQPVQLCSGAGPCGWGDVAILLPSSDAHKADGFDRLFPISDRILYGT